MPAGDARLSRRYAYARALLDEGNAEAAGDLLMQTLLEDADWAPAWHLLGETREAQGDRQGAIEAYSSACALDPAGLLGSEVDLARLGALDARVVDQPAYVAKLFDDYADRFEKHLRERLKYRGPEILFEAVARAASLMPRPLHFARLLDLGCGTGLVGEIFRARCDRIEGVDLSTRMVERTRRKKVYDSVAVAGLQDALTAEASGALDLIVAADVFVYVGELGAIFAEAARALEPAGLFAFTVQTPAEGEIAVGPDKRFAHSEAYLRRALAEAGLRPLILEAADVRHESGAPVPGLAIVAARA